MKLKELRKEHGLTQENVANMLHLQKQTYQNYELGKREPNIEILKILAQFYKVSLDYLLDFDPIVKNKDDIEISKIIFQLKPIAKGKVLGYAKAQLEQQNDKNKKININYIDF